MPLPNNPNSIMAWRNTTTVPGGFDCPLADDAESLLCERLDAFLKPNSFARQLAAQM